MEGAGGCGHHSGEDVGPAEPSVVLEAVVEGRGGECAHGWQSGGVKGGSSPRAAMAARWQPAVLAGAGACEREAV
jgi:hypothetical protein